MTLERVDDAVRVGRTVEVGAERRALDDLDGDAGSLGPADGATVAVDDDDVDGEAGVEERAAGSSRSPTQALRAASRLETSARSGRHR